MKPSPPDARDNVGLSKPSRAVNSVDGNGLEPVRAFLRRARCAWGRPLPFLFRECLFHAPCEYFLTFFIRFPIRYDKVVYSISGHMRCCGNGGSIFHLILRTASSACVPPAYKRQCSSSPRSRAVAMVSHLAARFDTEAPRQFARGRCAASIEVEKLGRDRASEIRPVREPITRRSRWVADTCKRGPVLCRKRGKARAQNRRTWPMPGIPGAARRPSGTLRWPSSAQ